jgi:hypothetical protein
MATPDRPMSGMPGVRGSSGPSRPQAVLRSKRSTILVRSHLCLSIRALRRCGRRLVCIGHLRRRTRSLSSRSSLPRCFRALRLLCEHGPAFARPHPNTTNVQATIRTVRGHMSSACPKLLPEVPWLFDASLGRTLRPWKRGAPTAISSTKPSSKERRSPGRRSRARSGRSSISRPFKCCRVPVSEIGQPSRSALG